MATMVLTSRRADQLHNGYDLRVAKLCAQVPDELHLVVVPMHALPEVPPTIDNSDVFGTTEEFAPLLDGPRSWRRHLRLSDDRFLALSRPAEFTAARRRLRAIVAELDVRRIVVFGGDLAELATGLGPHALVLDVCDSVALTRQRRFEHARRPWVGGWRDALELYRGRLTESRLPDRFDHVTTVSDVDTAEIVRLSGSAPNVRTVLNGVSEAYLEPMPAAGDQRGVIFWGNLDFAPNADAMSFFVNRVWLPVLRDAGVGLRVIGAGAPAWLQDLADREPLLEVSGFVPDLRAAVVPYPVMVNPMLTGSGLKNKVLEAFGLGIAVVSTAMGVEALQGVRDGEHLVVAEPDGLAAAVLALLDAPGRRLRLRADANALLHERYRWSVVGRSWSTLFPTSVAVAHRGPAGSDVDLSDA
jgi:glycosyltransferase involved in cell wall biosynthesis